MRHCPCRGRIGISHGWKKAGKYEKPFPAPIRPHLSRPQHAACPKSPPANPYRRPPVPTIRRCAAQTPRCCNRNGQPSKHRPPLRCPPSRRRKTTTQANGHRNLPLHTARAQLRPPAPDYHQSDCVAGVVKYPPTHHVFCYHSFIPPENALPETTAAQLYPPASNRAARFAL